jgi:hypothetical protein
MKERFKGNSEGCWDQGMDRRTFIRIAGVTGGLLVMPGLAYRDLFAAEDRIELEDPSYKEFYNLKGNYFQDPKWSGYPSMQNR